MHIHTHMHTHKNKHTHTHTHTQCFGMSAFSTFWENEINVGSKYAAYILNKLRSTYVCACICHMLIMVPNIFN